MENEVAVTAISDKALKMMESVRDNYRFHVRDFIRWLKGEGRELSLEVVKDYFIELNQADLAASTIRVKRQAVIKRIRQLSPTLDPDERARIDVWIRDLNSNPETKPPKDADAGIGMEKLISSEEFWKLKQGARSEKQRLMMEFLWTSGVRISEMLTTQLKACKQQPWGVNVKILGKGKKHRSIKIPNDLFERIRAEFKGEKYLFETSSGRPYHRCYVGGQIKKLSLAVLGRALSPHCFRHSFATRMIEKTQKIKGVSEYLGPSDTSIAMKFYCHEELNTEELFSLTELTG